MKAPTIFQYAKAVGYRTAFFDGLESVTTKTNAAHELDRFDEHVRADRRVLAHLEAKGKVSVITKAASFLLWYDDFSMIRTYLIDHLAWMISDASGIPPSYAAKAGLTL